MTVPYLNSFIKVGEDILASERDEKTNTLLLITGDVVSGATFGSGTEYWQQVGFCSVPYQVTGKTDAAQCLSLSQGDRDIVFATRDVRSHKQYASLKPGETCIFSTAGQGRSLYKVDGSVSHYTRVGNTESGKGMVINMNPANDSISIINSKGFGFIVDGDGIKITAGKASLVLNSDGSAKLIATGKLTIDGTAILLGANALPVAPVLKGLTGMAGLPSLKVTVE